MYLPGSASTSPSPTSPYIFAHLSDAELLASTRGCVARSNHQLAALLAHLAEVEEREIYRQRACASLCTFCIYELRMSEDAASRYARAARIARQFPILFGKIAAGEIHLTGVVLIAPHLTEENHRELLLRVKHRSKREIVKILRVIDPLPDVPPRIEPLGPALSAEPPASSTWQAFVDSRLPVRELPPGQRPADWLELCASETEVPQTQVSGADVTETAASETEASEQSEPAEVMTTRLPQRFKIQFQASQEYVDLLEKATDLLPFAARARALEDVHLRAMRLLVAELEKRKYGLSKPPHAPRSSTSSKRNAPERSELESDELGHDGDGAEADTDARQRESNELAGNEPESDATTQARNQAELAAPNTPESPRRRGRYVPVAARRTVYERDAGRCTYVDADGRRCRETSCLELHHLDPFSRGGPPTAENLALRCRPHNALAAEEDFGRAHMARKIGRD